MIVHDLQTDHGIVRWRETGDPQAPITAIWQHGTPGIAAPTLLVHGSDDRIVPLGHARWLARRIGGAELWVAARRRSPVRDARRRADPGLDRRARPRHGP